MERWNPTGSGIMKSKVQPAACRINYMLMFKLYQMSIMKCARLQQQIASRACSAQLPDYSVLVLLLDTILVLFDRPAR